MFNRTSPWLYLLLMTLLVATWGGISFKGNANAQEDSTNTPTPEDATPEYIFAWNEIAFPTAEQLDEARACDVSTLIEERYPQADFTIETLLDGFTPETGCDWAVLAGAYLNYLGDEDPPPPVALDAFTEMVKSNPALMFADSLIGYLHRMENFVAPPLFTQEALTKIEITHSWSGIGDTVDYHLVIEPGENEALVSGEINEAEGSDEVRPIEDTLPLSGFEKFQDVLTDFVPIQTQLEIFVCFDNYPEWDMVLTYADGTEVTLTTAGSNYFNFGGPWQMEYEEQVYLQYSPQLVKILISILIDELELPYGQTAASYCAFDGGLIDRAYPPEEDTPAPTPTAE